MKHGWTEKLLVVNIALLRTFQGGPISILGIRRQILQLQHMGLIKLAFARFDNLSPTIEEYFILSEKGQTLLKYFPENQSDSPQPTEDYY